MSEQDIPRCDKCGVEITTGFMCFFCPFGKDCDLRPQDADLQDFIEEQREAIHYDR